MRTIEYIYMTFIVSIDTNIDTRKKTYTKVIVSIDMKVIMSIDTINVVYIDVKKKKLT